MVVELVCVLNELALIHLEVRLARCCVERIDAVSLLDSFLIFVGFDVVCPEGRSALRNSIWCLVVEHIRIQAVLVVQRV